MTINTKEIREATGVYVYPADLQFKLIEAENIILKLCDRIDELEEKIKWLEGLGVPIKESLTQTVDDLTEKLKVAEEALIVLMEGCCLCDEGLICVSCYAAKAIAKIRGEG